MGLPEYNRALKEDQNVTTKILRIIAPPPPPLPAIKEKDTYTKKYVAEHNAKYKFFSFMVYSDTSNSMMCGISI